jgi:hypothetical protein
VMPTFCVRNAAAMDRIAATSTFQNMAFPPWFPG